MIDEEKIYRYLKKAEKLASQVGDKPLLLGFSGGKDSVVLKYYADKFGIKYEARFNNTQIEQWTGMLPFIKQNYPDVVIVNPPKANSFFETMAKKGEPSILRRWCCESLKHSNPLNKDYKVGVFGVRGAESNARKNRGSINVLSNSKRAGKRQEHLIDEFGRQDTEIRCYGDNGERVNIYPIFDLTNEDVWSVIRENNLAIPQPYKDGATRMGCALCPFAMAKENYETISTNPNICKAWLKAKEKHFDSKADIDTNPIRKLCDKDGKFDVVAYFYTYINQGNYTIDSWQKSIELYRKQDVFGNSIENDFRELLKSKRII